MSDLIEGKKSKNGGNISSSEIQGKYVESLKALKEAGINDISIVLFTPSESQKKLQTENFPEFKKLFNSYLDTVIACCEKAGVVPAYLQVMNEVNWSFQTDLGISQTVELIKLTKNKILGSDNLKNTKVMTTMLINPIPLEDNKKNPFDKIMDYAMGKFAPTSARWQADMKLLVEKCGSSLDAVGVDYYPGSYYRQAYSFNRQGDLSKSRPYKAFGSIEPYKWVFQQKLSGFLRDKEIIIAETGVPTLVHDSRWGQLGISRMLQSLDLLLLNFQKEEMKTIIRKYSEKNIKLNENDLQKISHNLVSNNILKGIIAFTGIDSPAVSTKLPRVGKNGFALDYTPWTFIRNMSNGLQITETAKRFKQMFDTKFPSDIN
jgi:hypothetical protein